MQSWELQLACQISHCFKSLEHCRHSEEVPGSGKKGLAIAQDVLDHPLQISQIPSQRHRLLKERLYHPVPFRAAMVIWCVLANETRAEVITLHFWAESLGDNACASVSFSPLPPDQQCAEERLLQWPELQVKTIWNRAAGNVDCDVHDRNVNDRDATWGKNKPLFFFKGWLTVLVSQGLRGSSFKTRTVTSKGPLFIWAWGISWNAGALAPKPQPLKENLLGKPRQVGHLIFVSHDDFWSCLLPPCGLSWTKLIYGLNIWVPSKFICWHPTHQYGYTWR